LCWQDLEVEGGENEEEDSGGDEHPALRNLGQLGHKMFTRGQFLQSGAICSVGDTICSWGHFV